MVYPRECPGCGTLTPEDGFAVDRHQSSGRKSRCRACHRRDAKAYHATVRKPRRLAALEAERAAEMKVSSASTNVVSRPCARKPRKGPACRRSSFASSAYPI
jgi:hypothetical protein